MPLMPEDVMIEVIKSNMQPEEKRLLVREINRHGPASRNRWTMRGVIFCLCLVALTAPVYIVALHVHSGSELPQALVSLSSTALGALAGLLTQRSGQD